MSEMFEIIKEYICQVFGFGETKLPLSEFTGWHIIILVIGTMLFILTATIAVALACYLVWHILKFFFKIFQAIFSAKKRCSKIICSSCGRTLDKCVCEKNKNRGYFRRLSLYSKEKKAAQKARKLALRESKKKDK